jgi:PEP-CTERM motif
MHPGSFALFAAMTRLFRGADFGGLVLAALILASVGSAHASATYDINLQGSYGANPPDLETIAGTITTDGALGYLQPSDIISWSLTASGELSASASSFDVGASFTCSTAAPSAGCFYAVGTALSFTSGAYNSTPPYYSATPYTTGFQGYDPEYSPIYNPQNEIALGSSPTGGSFVIFLPTYNATYQVTRGSVVAVPEADTYVMMLVGLGFVALATRRRGT